jgi:uncharacterized protein (DUF697 family)/GTP-binding protein EngB required for normal cell division
MSKFSWFNNWKHRTTKNLEKNLNDGTKRLKKLLPIDKVAQKTASLFNVSDDQVAQILTSIREKLPTTEAILIGKPQAGKSSIVRGLTGVSAEIIGQGFRPHTQNTKRYAYPSEDLPLLIFTDTVGLGDIDRNTQDIIQELELELKQETQRARILILTIKINDFATDTLQQMAKRLRQDYPNIPCLLVVTCLHEVYPDDLVDHPEYPPNYEAVKRSFQAIQQDFKELGDADNQESYRSVMIDFTLEEDGLNPTFYGMSALTEALAELLPEAESRTIYQLLDNSFSDELGSLYRDTARHYLLAFSIMAATLAAVPLPFATMPVLTALQISLVGLLGKLYGQTLSPSQAGGIASAIAGGFFAQAIGRELIKFIPGFGSVIAASWAAAYTWSLGEGACVYFGDLMGGKKPDSNKIQSVMKESFASAKEQFKNYQP